MHWHRQPGIAEQGDSGQRAHLSCAAPEVELVPVESALQMHGAVMARVSDCSVVIKAAVADYRPVLRSGEKDEKVW